MDIDDAYITENGLRGTPRSSSDDPPTSMTGAIHTFRIRRILGRIHTSLYSDVTPTPAKTDQTQIEQFRAEIEAWRASVTPTTSHTGEALSLFATSDWFDFEYNYTILQLYRSQIVESQDTATDKVFLDCLRAAEGICRGYRRQFLGKPTSYTWAALHELFLAGLTYLHCLWTSPSAREANRPGQVSSTCTDCTIVLVMMAERWDAAAPYRDIFEALANRTITMMDDKTHENWNLPHALTQPDDLDADDLMQWMTNIADTGMADGIDGLLTSLIGELPSQEQEFAVGSDL
jgi:hypothetical protein